MAASPQQSRSQTPLDDFEAVDLFRAREEALEARERRLLVREQHRHEGERRQLTRQQRVKGEIEIGERRLRLIGRLVLLVIAVVSAVVSAVLGVLGHLSPEPAIAVGVASGIFGAAVMGTGRGSRQKLEQQDEDDQRLH